MSDRLTKTGEIECRKRTRLMLRSRKKSSKFQCCQQDLITNLVVHGGFLFWKLQLWNQKMTNEYQLSFLIKTFLAPMGKSLKTWPKGIPWKSKWKNKRTQTFYFILLCFGTSPTMSYPQFLCTGGLSPLNISAWWQKQTKNHSAKKTLQMFQKLQPFNFGSNS